VGLYRYDGKLLTRDGALATSENCCCGSVPKCCGIPENCVLSLTWGDVTFIYNPATGFFESEDDPTFTFSGVSFGSCDESPTTPEPVWPGWEYRECCLSASIADTPLNGELNCLYWAKYVFTILKCVQCCDTSAPMEAIGCELSETVVIFTDNDGNPVPPGQDFPCAPFIPNLFFSMTCTGEACNEFP
jgi:hypothetical protein